MALPWLRGRRADAGEAGFTLIELLVASSMSLILIGAVVAMLTSVLRNQPENAERSAQIQDARVMLERTVRELRQGVAVEGLAGTPSSLTIDTYVRSGCNGGAPTASAVVCRVTYACSGSAGAATCTRTAGPSGTPITYMTGLGSPDVFSYGTNASPTCEAATTGAPKFVCVNLTYDGDDGSETVTIEDSAYLRNTGA
jgi:prepilin-type N-terminal cleavage/methylation domain-containing protein